MARQGVMSYVAVKNPRPEVLPMTKPIYKIFIFLKRRAGMSLAEFQDYYETKHSKLCQKYMVGVTKYRRDYITPLPDPSTGVPAEMEFDVITELWFEDRKIFDAIIKAASRGQMPDDVIEDEKRVFDRTKIRYASVIEQESEI
jgi:hypothetical protein